MQQLLKKVGTGKVEEEVEEKVEEEGKNKSPIYFELMRKGWPLGLERSFSNSKSEQVGLSPGALRAHLRWSFLVPG